MSKRSLGLPDPIYDYLLSVSLREPEILKRLRAETAKLPMGGMQIAPEQGQLLSLLVQALNPKRCLEVAHGQAGSFDFAFIDADKENYWGYYERALALLRPGGLIAIDNTIWSGRPADPKLDDPGTRAIRAFNQRLSKDSRVRISLVPIGDGMTLALKLRG